MQADSQRDGFREFQRLPIHLQGEIAQSHRKCRRVAGVPNADGLSDWDEYLSGTEPTNPASALKVQVVGGTNAAGALSLRWPVVAGRTYEVLGSPTLTADPWSSVAGPWIATFGQTVMEWTLPPSTNSSFFRINLVCPPVGR